MKKNQPPQELQNLTKSEIDQFYHTFGLIKLGNNKVKRLLNLSQDLARLHKIPLEILWKERAILSITRNEKLSPLDKYKKVTQWLHSKLTIPSYDDTPPNRQHRQPLTPRPEKIYVLNEASKTPNAQKILSKLDNVPVEFIDDVRQIKRPMGLNKAKKVWLLNIHKGIAFKACQGISNSNLCCNYWTLDTITGCCYDCTYCILQHYLANNPVTTIYTNLDDMLAQIKTHTSQKHTKIFRIGTGELSDSLAFDAITEHSSVLVPFFSNLPNAYLELKTKSASIQNLKKLNHNGHTIIAFSINPEPIITNEEIGTTGLAQRINAARLCAEWEYKLAFHFDPIIYYQGWEKDYTDVIRRIAERIDPKQIVWVSLGCLRFPLQLKEIAQKRFPRSAIFSCAFVKEAGKIRYHPTIRLKLYNHIISQIRSFNDSIPIYLCMETKDMWHQLGFPNINSNNDVEKLATARLRITS